MSKSNKFSLISMTILEFLAVQTTPQTAKQIIDTLKPEWHEKAKYLFSSLVRIEAIVAKAVPGTYKMSFVIAKHGREIIKNKKTLILVENVKAEEQGKKHPDTGEPISAYKLRKLLEERGQWAPNKKSKAKPEPAQGALALPNVSSNANNLMDHISTVIHENAAYREALARIGNDIAALLDMRMIPRQQPTE